MTTFRPLFVYQQVEALLPPALRTMMAQRLLENLAILQSPPPL